MARKIQIKRGNKSKLPTLAQGELALCLDEQSLYAGGSSGNIPVGGKAITPALIGAATTAQVNSAVSTHNSSTSAHSDIRNTLSLVTGTLNDVGNESMQALADAAAAKTTANAAVKRAGDTMTGKLTLPSAELRSNRIWATITPSGDSAGLLFGIYDDLTGLESAFGVGTEGLTFYDRMGNGHSVYHEGNQPSLEAQEGDVFGKLTVEGYDAPGGGIAYRVRLFTIDDNANGCGLILYPGKGVYIMDNNGNEYEVIHAGNIARYTG